MDTANHFFTKATSMNARAEYMAALIACLALMIAHWSTLNVWLAIALFGYIDLFSTVPGLIAYRMSVDGQVPRAYYVLYDVLHSAVTQGVLIAGFVAHSGFQWALLAIPVHLSIDRGIFNNYPKPFDVAFDPVRHPAFERFLTDYAAFDSRRVDWKAIKRTASDVNIPLDVQTGSGR